MSHTLGKLFCFGYGYVADRLARTLRESGQWDIVGTTRDAAKRDAMAEAGIEAYHLGYDESLTDPYAIFSGVTHVLISVPPDDYGDSIFRSHGDDLRHIRSLQWVGYLSTTGVYGDRGGDWVDEESDLNPQTRRGDRRIKAESQWMDLYQAFDLPTHIFRLAGIYGPGRNVLDSVRAGVARRIFKAGHAFSRIHIEDLVQVLRASMAHPHPGRIYNVADDYPAPSHEIIAYACEMLGRTPPPLLDYASADLAPITMSFYSDNKRVRNDRIKDELKVRLRYPSFHEGLLACLRAEQEGETGALPPHWFAEGRETLNTD